MPSTLGVVSSGRFFSPLHLAPALWLDAADTATITASDGAVSQWDDKSGNGRHVTQGVAAAQPRIGTRTVNNLNVVDFDGGDVLTGTTTALMSPLAPFSIFTVALFDTSPGTVVSQCESVRQFQLFASPVQCHVGGTNVVGNALNSGVAAVPGVTYSAPTAILWDRNATFSQSVGLSTVASPVRIGARGDGAGGTTSRLDGAIGEVVVVARALTAGEITSLRAYFTAKWRV